MSMSSMSFLSSHCIAFSTTVAGSMSISNSFSSAFDSSAFYSLSAGFFKMSPSRSTLGSGGRYCPTKFTRLTACCNSFRRCSIFERSIAKVITSLTILFLQNKTTLAKWRSKCSLIFLYAKMRSLLSKTAVLKFFYFNFLINLSWDSKFLTNLTLISSILSICDLHLLNY